MVRSRIPNFPLPMALRSWVVFVVAIVGLWNVAGAETTQQNLRGLHEEPDQLPRIPERANRIINGNDVLEFRYPYFSLMYGTGMCGGVLISPTLVLSAAHCKNAADVFRVGAYKNAYDGKFVQIRSAIVHPDYRISRFDKDIMIFQLEKASKNPYLKLNKDEMRDGKFTVLGFGDTDPGTPLQLAGKLQEVELSYVNNNKCDKGHGGNGEVKEDMMCVAADDKDSCIGDSGGPLILKGETPKDDSLVGVVSWGRECAKDGVPGVYSRISYFYDWIVETVCNNFPRDAPPYMGCIPTPSPTPEPQQDVTDFLLEREPTVPTITTGESTQNSTDVNATDINTTSIDSILGELSSMTEAPTEIKYAMLVHWSFHPLNRCEGHCIANVQCVGDLICFKRNSASQEIPGCVPHSSLGVNVNICISPP